jgi:non-heme chloroperoxidase
MFGFSTGGGEVTCYVARKGTANVTKIGLISAVPPLMVKNDGNLGGVPNTVFDGIRAGLLANRPKLFRDIPSGPFYGFSRPGKEPDQGLIDFWWLQGMQGGHKNTYDSIKASSETDFREGLKRFDKPTLIVYGDDDQVVPIDAAGRASK